MILVKLIKLIKPAIKVLNLKMLFLCILLAAAFLINIIVHASDARMEDNDNSSSNTNTSRKRSREIEENIVEVAYLISTADSQKLSTDVVSYFTIGNFDIAIGAACGNEQENASEKESGKLKVTYAKNKGGPPSNDNDDEESDAMKDAEAKQGQVYTRYCNIKEFQQKDLRDECVELIPGNFLLISDNAFQDQGVSKFMHGVQIGAIRWHNINVALVTLFPESDIWMILFQDFPHPTDLQVPQINGVGVMPRSQSSSKEEVWTMWPLNIYDHKERAVCFQKFASEVDKDLFLNNVSECCLYTLSEKYPQLYLFTRICRDLDFSKPWTLYESLEEGTFVPSMESKKENLVVAFYLIHRDAEVLKELVPEYDSISSVVKLHTGNSSVSSRDSFIKLSFAALSILGVCKQTLQKKLQQYNTETIFADIQQEDEHKLPFQPEKFMLAVDQGNLPEIHGMDAPLILSLIRHFLLCSPPSDHYLRTLLWLYRDAAPTEASILKRIKEEIRDMASLKALELANEHCASKEIVQ